ncbi:MAG: hypothetical protein WEB53_03505 [Akkermansiaceae bacterium]
MIQPRNGAVVMNGRTTPVRALNQMTNVQKATESGTPANPTWDSGMEAVATESSDVSGWIQKRMRSKSRAFGGLNFKSVEAGAMGEGFCSTSPLLAQGHDANSSQQDETVQG